MGFYGDVTGVASTQFSFDKTFPNRVALDGNPAGDGVYINRFVLIEYGEKQSDDYKRNEEIDMNKYQANYDSTVWQKIYSDNGAVKYVMIAELNAAIPKFGLVPVAPSEVPLTPEFDKFSTDDHYTLRWQVPWGFRVKPAEEGKVSDIDEKVTYKTYEAQKTADGKPVFNNNGNIKYNVKEIEKPISIYFNASGFNKDKSTHDNTSENEIKLSTASSGKLYETSNDESRDWATADDIQELSISLPAIGNMVADGYDIIYGKQRDNSKSESLQGILDTYTEMEGNKIPYKRLLTGEIVGAELVGDNWIAAQLDDNNQQINITHKDPVSISDSNVTIDLNNGENQFNYDTLEIDNKGHVKKGVKTTTVIVPNGFNEIKDINGASLVKATTPTSAFKIATDNWIKVNKSEDSEATLKLYHETHSRNWEYQKVNENNDKTYFEFNATGVVDDAGHIEYYSPTKVYFPWSFSKIQSDEENSLINAKKVNDTFKIGGDYQWTETSINDNEILVEHKIKEKAKKEKFTDFRQNYNFIDVIVDEAGHIVEYINHPIPYGLASANIYDKDNVLFQISSVSVKDPTNAAVEIYGDDFINLTGVTKTELSEDQRNIVYNTGFKIQHKTTNTTPSKATAVTTNKIYVNNVNWDSAGHIVECDPKEYILLTLKTPSSNSSITQNENDGSITIKGNTAIQHPDENDTSVSIQTQWIDVSHENDVITIDHKDPNKTDINKVELGNSNSLTVPYLSYDSKGHVFNGGTKELIGDDYISIDAKNDEIKISHNNSILFENSDQEGWNIAGDANIPSKLEAGTFVTFPYIVCDEKGHINQIDNRVVQLPSKVADQVSVGINYKDNETYDSEAKNQIIATIWNNEDNPGTITASYTGTDTLELRNYITYDENKDYSGRIKPTDTINQAIEKLEYRVNKVPDGITVYNGDFKNNNSQIIENISYNNGQINPSFLTTRTLRISEYHQDMISDLDKFIDDGDTINGAFRKLQFQISGMFIQDKLSPYVKIQNYTERDIYDPVDYAGRQIQTIQNGMSLNSVLSLIENNIQTLCFRISDLYGYVNPPRQVISETSFEEDEIERIANSLDNV